MMKRLILLISIAAVLILLFLLFTGSFKHENIKSIITTGTVEGKEVNIASKITGRISEICCDEGDAVKEGDRLILLDNGDLTASVEQARASLRTAHADIKTSEANIDAVRARLDEAKKHMERIKNLYDESLVPRSAYDAATADLDTASAVYKASLSQLLSAESKRKEAEAALSFHEARLSDTVITAPISGTVAFKGLEAGEFVSPGVAVLTIVDTDNLWVRTDVEETQISMITIGSEAFIAVDTVSGKRIKGSVSEIGRYAEFATQKDVRHGVQDIKTFHVKIRVQDAEKILKPGMTVEVEIPIKK